VSLILSVIHHIVLTFKSLINVLKAANQPVPNELLKFGTVSIERAQMSLLQR